MKPEPTAKRARILVIDDDPLFRSLIVGLLRPHYYVSVAREGSEGFFKALEQPPDLAVIDMQMPGWDGPKTLREFRSHPALASVKTMILAGYTTRRNLLRAFDDGANDYVVKTNFSKDELLTKIAKLLSQPGSPARPAVAGASSCGAAGDFESAPSDPRLASGCGCERRLRERGLLRESVIVPSHVAAGTDRNAAIPAHGPDDWATQKLIDDWE